MDQAPSDDQREERSVNPLLGACGRFGFHSTDQRGSPITILLVFPLFPHFSCDMPALHTGVATDGNPGLFSGILQKRGLKVHPHLRIEEDDSIQSLTLHQDSEGA